MLSPTIDNEDFHAQSLNKKNRSLTNTTLSSIPLPAQSNKEETLQRISSRVRTEFYSKTGRPRFLRRDAENQLSLSLLFAIW